MPENSAKKEATVLWLLPAGPMRSAFRRTIANLAEKYDGPVFAPHLTLGFGDAPARQDFAHQPIALPAGEICFTTQFTKNLFLRFAPTPDLVRLRNSLGVSEAAEYDPHLSLFYGHLPHATQTRLAASLHFPFRSVVFDEIQVIRGPLPTTTRAEVESWKVVASRKLTAR